MNEVAHHERPWSEQYRIIGKKWVEADGAARLLEDLKTTTLAQKIAELGDIPYNKAERTVKASKTWREFIEKMVEARTEANLLKVQMEYIRMNFEMERARNYAARTEAHLTR